MIVSSVLVAAVALYTTLAAVTDLRWRRIPNWLTLPTAAAGLIYHGCFAGGWGFSASLAGLAIGFALLLIPFLAGGGGMGDVKLLAALGAWLGPQLMLVAFAISIIAAAAMSLAVLAYGIVRHGFAPDDATSSRPRRTLPFALPVALGTWAMLAWLTSFAG